MYEIGEEELEALRRVFESRKLFRYQAGEGGECDRFEREFSEQLGTKHAILLSTGTNALVAALVGHGIGQGDEVIVPAYTFVATAAAVRLAGARPVIVNVDEELGLSVEDARSKITARTKAILPVHMDGLSADMSGILSLAQERGLLVIEDCAQALGGSYKDRRLGSMGNAGAFSLNENKNLSCGEGGIVVTSDPEVHARMFCLQDLSSPFNPHKRAMFQGMAPFLGMSMRVSEIQGAIMRVQLTRLEGILARLRERKAALVEVLARTSEAKILRGHCALGDCASSLHLRFSDPGRAAAVSRRLMSQGILAAFPTLRPAHVAWKWLDLIDQEGAQQTKADLLPSMDLLMGVLKLDLDPKVSLPETRALGDALATAVAHA